MTEFSGEFAFSEDLTMALQSNATTEELDAVRDAILAAIAAIDTSGSGGVTQADLDALKAELLAAINAPRTLLPPV